VIGVVARADEQPVVEEFFELFKTPWEFYERGRTYDVVVATAGEIPVVDARLVVIYGSDIKNTDAALSVGMSARHRGGTLSVGGSPLPIYGDLLTFARECAGTQFLESSSGMAGLTIRLGECTIKRLGYDVFREVRFLLSEGQPTEHAHIPTLDIHIALLRNWILEAGIPLVEIPPAPQGYRFLVCLTHDIDFIGIRKHFFDHTMWGFLYRSTLGAVRSWLRRRISLARLLKMWGAAAALPFVYLKWAKDFWDPFDWYLRVEKHLAATYYIVPVKGHAGERVTGRHASRRAAAYDVSEVADRLAALVKEGCEVGVHGIDAWHNVERALDERAKVAAVAGASTVGVRMHWLLRDANTPSVLEAAGYAYDSTLGYNETIGYRNGTTQAFRPLGVQTLLELPLHIQDGALFFSQRLGLSEPEARTRCDALIDNADRFGGVLTVLWHDRSHGPERFWGDFYIRLVHTLRSLDGWFATALDAVSWFRQRRAVRFERVDTTHGARMRLRYQGGEIRPPVNIRVHRPAAGGGGASDMSWNGMGAVELDAVECSPAGASSACI
jgi:hypothetical protein